MSCCPGWFILLPLFLTGSAHPSLMSDPEKTDALVHLAGSVAHELNNIFTAVAGNLSFLEDAFDREDSNSHLIDDVIRTARRGMELSAKLQAFAGRQPLRRVRIDLNQAIVQVVTGLKTSVLRAIDVQLDLARTACIVSVDQEKLHSLIVELATNAATAMEQHGRLSFKTAAVMLKEGDVARLAAGPYQQLTVRDWGRGMQPEIAARALDPFFTTRSGGGGWGLSKCAGFVRQCGGRIGLSSTPGQGTAVKIYLPKYSETTARG